MWAIACNREDLLQKNLEELHRSYKLCSDHFNKNMFTNKECNRLNYNTYPTLFPFLEGSSALKDHNYSLPALVKTDVLPNKIKVLQNIVIHYFMEIHSNVIRT